MSEDVRARMAGELRSKAIFRDAERYAFEYIDGISERETYPGADALARLAEFDEPLPESPGDAKAVLDRLHRAGSPATVAQTGGRYFGFVNGGALPITVAARWLTDAWDQNPALHVISPAVSRIEAVAERWLADLLGLGDGIAAGFVGGSSVAIFAGLAAARYRCFERLGWDINAKGFSGAPPLRIVAGEQAHGTVGKAVALLGFGLDAVEWVPADDQGRMMAERLPPLDESTILVLQAGHVTSGAFDPLGEICDRARDAGAWTHIDGAFGLWTRASPALGHLTRGVEAATSWSLDGHKTLNAPYDNGILLCRDRDALAAAMQASGSYIMYGEERDGMRYTPEMSRRARAVELWAALRYLGRAGVAELVDGLHARARQFANGLAAAGFRVLNDVVFNQVVAAASSAAETRRVMTLVQQSGECWAGGAEWRGEPVIRISVCSWATSADDVSRAVAAFAEARERAAGEAA